MRLKQQVKLIVFLSLFSVGIGAPAFCITSESEQEQIPLTALFGEIEEDESKEELEKSELITALLGAKSFDIILSQAMDRLYGNSVFTPIRTACRPENPRAPPALNGELC